MFNPMHKKNQKRRTGATAVLLSALLLLSACSSAPAEESDSSGASQQGSTSASSLSVERMPVDGLYAAEDIDASYDADNATAIAFSGGGISADGPGVVVSDKVVTITAAGAYILSGSMADGQVVVDAGKSDVVRLVIDGLQLSCSDSAPIYGKQADKVIVTLAEGSSNTLTDASDYVYPDAATDEPDAALFVKDDLTINGNGSLTVYGNFNNGIGCKDNLVIAGGTLSVTAMNHGIRGRDSLVVVDGDLTVSAGSDGLQSNNDEDPAKGWINLLGGSYDITSVQDGIQAETSLTISGGSYTIVSGGSSDNRSGSTDSSKGLKAGGDLVVSGGSFVIDAYDDAVHSNGDIALSAGAFVLSTGDDGVHADGTLTITGGDIEVAKSYEGLEGAHVVIEGGDIRVTATDDGINAAGGNDGGAGGGFGPDRFSGAGDYAITISGGTVTVSAQGDGVDSNGDITMSGGTLIVHGPTGSGNGALDYDGSFALTGGMLAAVGGAGMAQNPGEASTQVSLCVTFSSVQEAGQAVSLVDSEGNLVMSLTPEKSWQHVVLSSPGLKEGETYTVYAGGRAEGGKTTDGLTVGGTLSDGSKLFDITLGAGANRVSDSGEAVSGGMMGGGGRPGGGGGGRPGGGTPPAGNPAI